MPTLLQINSLVNKGSTGRIAEDIGQHVMSKNWESYIAFGRESNQSKSKTVKIGTDLDQKMHGLSSRLFDNHGLSSKGSTKSLIQEIEKIQPSLIHLHNIHGYYLNYQLLFSFLAKANYPVVWTFHDCWPMTGHCSHFADIDCKKWETTCSSCPKKKNYPTSWFLDRSTTNHELKKKHFGELENLNIVTVSEWLKNIVGKSFLQKKNTQAIHNGIDLDKFKPTTGENFKSKLPADKKILLGVATTWQAYKGYNDYLKLREKLSEEYSIVMVGLSEEQISHLPKGIIGIKRTESIEELAYYYSQASIVLNLSYQESFGLTTVEGFACGTPAVVYNATASPELVTAETGKIVAPGNIDQLVDAIQEISSKPKSHYSQKCRTLAEQKYNKNDRYEDYFNLYQNILGVA